MPCHIRLQLQMPSLRPSGQYATPSCHVLVRAFSIAPGMLDLGDACSSSAPVYHRAQMRREASAQPQHAADCCTQCCCLMLFATADGRHCGSWQQLQGGRG